MPTVGDAPADALVKRVLFGSSDRAAVGIVMGCSLDPLHVRTPCPGGRRP